MRAVSKQGHLQPCCHSKDRSQSRQQLRQVSHLCTASVKSVVILGQYMMYLAMFIVYWIPRWERWAQTVISVLMEWGIMILVPPKTRPFWVESSSLQGQQYSRTQRGLCILSLGEPVEINDIRVCKEAPLLASWRICSRCWSVTKVASSRFVSSTSYRNLSSCTWNIR